MKKEYIDYPETYSNNTINSLNYEYSKKAITPNSFLSYLQGENTMTKIQQNEPIDSSQPPTQPNFSNEDFRLFSLISSNYCNLINLLSNLIAKTSSSKREIYQTILAQLRVDSTTFNNTFNTVCNIESGNFCNYNSLVYLIIENFIDLTQNLDRLTPTTDSLANDTIIRLQNNTYDMFRTFVGARPIRY